MAVKSMNTYTGHISALFLMHLYLRHRTLFPQPLFYIYSKATVLNGTRSSH
uniref:Uncharacterized protein n=1 Tax=Anguilla anguilla TaxID=7936 RepID=A0A0E9PZU3_ANGAN